DRREDPRGGGRRHGRRAGRGREERGRATGRAEEDRPRLVPRSASRAPTLRERALRLLARREYTRQELARRLAPHAASDEEVTRALEECEGRGWLSEQRVVEQLVHARRARFGARRIERDLIAKGVAAEAVAAAL